MAKLDKVVLFLVISFMTVCCGDSQNRIIIGGREYFIQADLYDRSGAASYCQSQGAQLIVFETEKEQLDITSYLYTFDYPYMRTYWTDGIRSQINLNMFIWETSGVEIEQVLWAPKEPSESLDNCCAYFLPQDVKLVTGADFFTHSVICEKY
ncbi:uncharacterized protein LOC132202761 [Neocloeon triangulifer]|uniref:uncharacterized protein LOC132202761 n=1 Tax=Neocloeon triangulifer TaxID=2078957 RepID=UPI00286F8BDF|nr:uncharacterized protein LOC132202761 [Neocloeon triangulifer]